MGRGCACSLFCMNTGGRAGAHPGTKFCVFTPAAIAATSMPNVNCERRTLAHSLLKEKVCKKKELGKACGYKLQSPFLLLKRFPLSFYF